MGVACTNSTSRSNRRPQKTTDPMSLTTKQRAVFTFLKRRIIAGTCPTIREIQKHFGFASPNGVRCHLEALKFKGYIELKSMQARSIRLLRERPTCPHCGGEL